MSACADSARTRKVITCNEDDTLAKLEEGMLTFRVRHLPVVDGDRLFAPLG